MRLTGKVAIVTGAAQGIGLGIAGVFAREGASVTLSDVQSDAGARAVQAITSEGGDVCYQHADVTREADVKALVDTTVDRFGGLDIIANNAGICMVRSAEESTVEEWDQTMAINVRSIFLTTKHGAPYLRRRGGGAILNVASISSFVGQEGTPAYTASKGAVLMLTKSLAVDYGRDKIRVNCICPGITDTPMLRYHMGQAGDVDQAIEKRLRRVPLGEMLYPDDMGRAAAYLCSDEAGGITGASLVVDSGYIACAEFDH
ncbi:MAG: SDR family oxidoreductase [Candidatus Hydrogenedentes bacterium]|nr:SDR family oxidoreductase [Candidatus Hydrogenedentota bacterium]